MRRCTLALAALLPLLLLARETGADSASREPELKAVFLFNFSHFTDWPAAAFASDESPLVIGLLGKDPFGSILDEVIRGEKVSGHPLVVARFKRLEDVKECHILFVADSEARQLRAILTRLAGRTILSVSDMEGFADQGGMVQFITVNNRIQLRIDLEAVNAAKLTLSSKLLRAAEIVTTTKK